jgi:hypothetical protein
MEGLYKTTRTFRDGKVAEPAQIQTVYIQNYKPEHLPDSVCYSGSVSTCLQLRYF